MFRFRDNYIDHYRKNLKIALPVAASQLGHIFVGVADTIMVGALGGIPLAAATVAFSIFIPVMMLGIGISYGISPLIAKADGENNTEEISSILKHSFILNMVIGVGLALLLYVASPLLWHLDQQEEVIVLAIPFFELLAISMIPLMFFQTFRQFAEGLAITKQAMYITITGNVLNIAINYFIISGKHGFPALGVNGAGYATLIARIFMGIAMMAFIYYYPRFKEYRKNLSRIVLDSKVFVRLTTMSLPVGLQLSLESAAFGFAALMVGWIGSNEIAAHHIALNMAAVTYMAATGIASAATVRVGNAYGRKDFRELKAAGLSAFHIVIAYMSLCAIGFILFKETLPHYFIQEKEIETIATSLLLISAFFQLSDGVQVVGLGALRGIGDVKMPTAIALVAYWLIGIPAGYVFAFVFNMGAEGIWYGLFLGLTVAALSLYIRFHLRSRDLLHS